MGKLKRDRRVRGSRLRCRQDLYMYVKDQADSISACPVNIPCRNGLRHSRNYTPPFRTFCSIVSH